MCSKCCRKKNNSDQNELSRETEPNLENIIAFVNLRSGKQYGVKMYENLTRYLSKDNVFDLRHEGPHVGLEKHKNKTNLKVIACGGDGTVGWVMSAIDELNLRGDISVATMPLGTGNDLGRTLGWGCKYKKESVEKFIRKVLYGKKVKFDRWSLKTKPIQCELRGVADAKDSLPLNVFNNYFSFGADAKIALDFHIARERKPEAFNNISYNKIVYAKSFVKDLFLYQSCKSTVESIATFECDGVDYLNKIKELECHSIVFVNIQSYANGRNPWKGDKKSTYTPQSYSDGKFEVVGFKTVDLMWLQVGAHGDTIAQASKVKIVTNSPLPMQVDGEPCMLEPSEILIDLKNQSTMIIHE